MKFEGTDFDIKENIFLKQKMQRNEEDMRRLELLAEVAEIWKGENSQFCLFWGKEPLQLQTK